MAFSAFHFECDPCYFDFDLSRTRIIIMRLSFEKLPSMLELAASKRRHAKNFSDVNCK